MEDINDTFPTAIAIPKPSDKQLEDIKRLCEISKVGLIVTQGGKVEVVCEPPEINPLDHEGYAYSVRARAAMFLSFRQVFDNEIKFRHWWCSTKDRVQYTAEYWGASIRLGINIENIRGMPLGPPQRSASSSQEFTGAIYCDNTSRAVFWTRNQNPHDTFSKGCR